MFPNSTQHKYNPKPLNRHNSRTGLIVNYVAENLNHVPNNISHGLCSVGTSYVTGTWLMLRLRTFLDIITFLLDKSKHKPRIMSRLPDSGFSNIGSNSLYQKLRIISVFQLVLI